MLSGLVIAWRLATVPTTRSPSLLIATMDGVVRLPSWLGMTIGSPPSMTATTEFVVPRSMPMTFAMSSPSMPAGPRRPLERYALSLFSFSVSSADAGAGAPSPPAPTTTSAGRSTRVPSR